MSKQIKAIFLDLGGTFRIVEVDKPYTDQAKRLAQRLGEVWRQVAAETTSL